MIWTVLLDAIEGNVAFHLMAHSVEIFDDYTLIVDGIELMTKDRIIDVVSNVQEEDLDF